MTETTNITAGLELARKLLEGDCSAFVECHTHPVSGLSPADEHIKRDYIAAIAAITGATGELQRLSAERDELAARLNAVMGKAAELVSDVRALADESDGVAGLHLNGDIARWGELLPGGRFERLTALDDLEDLLSDQQPPAAEADALRRERDELAARLAEIEAQQPSMYVLRSTAGSVRPTVVTRTSLLSCAQADRVDAGEDHLDPLFARPAPAATPAAKPCRCGLDGCADRSEKMEDDHKQAEGSKNCMQCAAAYMLGLPVAAVPDFERACPRDGGAA